MSHLTLVGSDPQPKPLGIGLWLKAGAVVILITFFMLAGVVFVSTLLTEMAKAALR